jgi:hypothetical protein
MVVECKHTMIHTLLHVDFIRISLHPYTLSPLVWSNDQQCFNASCPPVPPLPRSRGVQLTQRGVPRCTLQQRQATHRLWAG